MNIHILSPEEIIEQTKLPYKTKSVSKEGLYKKGYIICFEKDIYKKSDTVLIRCPFLHVYSSTVSNILRGYGCKKCSMKNLQTKLRESNTFSKEWFVEKYGEERGIEKYNRRNLNIKAYSQRCRTELSKKLKKANSLEGFILRYGEELGREKFFKMTAHLSPKRNVSKQETDFIDSLEIEGKRQFRLDRYKYDFVSERYKIAVEYNGSNWHGNPKIYDISDKPNPYKKSLTSQDIWEYDYTKYKTFYYEFPDYKYFIVWDSDDLDEKRKEINEYLCRNH